MPRSDKPISTGQLNDPVSPSRGHGLAKYADPGPSDEFEPDPGVRIDPLTQESLDVVVDLVERQAPAAGASTPDWVPPSPVYEWTTVRSIDGRSYVRIDERRLVNAESDADET